MHSADRRSRPRSELSPTALFDTTTGNVTLMRSFAAPDAVVRMRRTLESALYSEAQRVTVDLTGVTQLPAPALRELEVARCLGGDMGRELRMAAAPGSAAADVLACADLPFAHARRRPR